MPPQFIRLPSSLASWATSGNDLVRESATTDPVQYRRATALSTSSSEANHINLVGGRNNNCFTIGNDDERLPIRSVAKEDLVLLAQPETGAVSPASEQRIRWGVLLRRELGELLHALDPLGRYNSRAFIEQDVTDL